MKYVFDININGLDTETFNIIDNFLREHNIDFEFAKGRIKDNEYFKINEVQ